MKKMFVLPIALFVLAGVLAQHAANSAAAGAPGYAQSQEGEDEGSTPRRSSRPSDR